MFSQQQQQNNVLGEWATEGVRACGFIYSVVSRVKPV